MPDLELIRKHLLEEGTIGKPELVRLIKDVTHTFSNILIKYLLSIENEPNILKMQEPVIIIGDIHG